MLDKMSLFQAQFSFFGGVAERFCVSFPSWLPEQRTHDWTRCSFKVDELPCVGLPTGTFCQMRRALHEGINSPCLFFTSSFLIISFRPLTLKDNFARVLEN